MKRLTFLLLSCIVSCIALAQKNWTCAAFDTDLEKYNQVVKDYKSKGNRKWAEKLLEAFPLASDNTIKYQYVIKSDSTYNVEDISNILLSWYKIKMTNVNPNPTGAPDRLSGIAILQNVGRYVGYMNSTFINAQEEVTIDIKDDRVRVTVAILSYIQANTWNGAEKVSPGACYPTDKSGKQKDSHAMAFINCHYDAINTIANIVKHLNDNTKTLKDGDEDW